MGSSLGREAEEASTAFTKESELPVRISGEKLSFQSNVNNYVNNKGIDHVYSLYKTQNDQSFQLLTNDNILLFSNGQYYNKIKKITKLEKELVVLNEFGEVFIFNECHQSWNKITASEEKHERIKFIDIISSEINLFGITSNNEIYGLSVFNKWGQLGIGNSEENNYIRLRSYKNPKITFQKVKTKEKFIKIYPGYGHTFFLNQNYQLFGCGSNDCGQLGYVNTNILQQQQPDNIYHPTILNAFKNDKISLITSGYAYGIIILQNGKGFVFGSNSYGQLGYDPQEYLNIYIPMPLKVNNLNSKIVNIYSGQYVTIIKTLNNDFYISGKLNLNYSEFTKINWNTFSIENTILDIYLQKNTLIILQYDTYHFIVGKTKKSIKLSDDKKYFDFPLQNDWLENGCFKILMLNDDYINFSKILFFYKNYTNDLFITKQFKKFSTKLFDISINFSFLQKN
ncbi:hypothetical protein ABK040_002039 [Willaertia magna]